MKRFLHCADVHLGFSAYDHFAENGLNVRENDVYGAWMYFINHAKQVNPDFILIAGDLFDSDVPSPQTYIAVSALLSVKCPVLVLMGNHEKPRTGNYSPTTALISLGFKPITEPQFVEVAGLTVFCAPSTGTVYELKPADLLLAHGPIDGPEEYKNVSGKLNIDTSKYKYCALGDLHFYYTRDNGKLVYPGSLIPLTFNQEGKICGFVEGVINDDGTVTHTHIQVPHRKLITIDATDPEALKNTAIEQIEGAVVRIITDNADVVKLKQALEQFAFHVKVTRFRVEQEASTIKIEGKTLRDEYVDFCNKKGRPDLIEPGLKYMKITG